MNRREFASTLAVATTAAYPMLSGAMRLPSHTGGNIPIEASASALQIHAVYDTRLCMPEHVIEKYFRDMDKVYRYQGDITAVWYDSLDLLWSDRKIATQGITRHAEFFILATLASERKYRVSYLREFDDHAIWRLEPR